MRNLIQQYAKDLTAGRLASGYEHSYRIYHLAREIGEALEYDDEVLHAACFLHDVEVTARHPEASAEKARSILQETGFTPGKIQAVCQAVADHMPGAERPDASVEAKLLHDANLLDTLGAIGFARLAIGSFFWFHHKTMGEVLSLMRQWRGYADRFYFPESRRLAARKVEFLDMALEELSNELSL